MPLLGLSGKLPSTQKLPRLALSQGRFIFLHASPSRSKANEYARNHGLRTFSVYQGRWSAANRDLEREIIPMCKAEGMAIAPWNALGGGRFKTEQQRAQGGREVNVSEADIKISQTLERIAVRLNTALTSVALAYVMHKAPYVFPIVGGHKVHHLKGNIEALTLSLSPEDIKEIESALPFDIGFPNSILWGSEVPDTVGQVAFLRMGGTLDHVPEPKVRACTL